MSDNFKLEKKENFNCKAKFLIVVLDGVGFIDPKNNINFSIQTNTGILPAAPFHYGNSVNATYTPNLFKLYSSQLFRTLKAHGKAVGLPSDEDMGNSEVGHNALGAGRIFAQGAKLVNAAFKSGKIFEGEAWLKTVDREELKSGKKCLHFCGLLSDGNVHSHIEHLFSLIEGAKTFSVKKVRLHILLDGRDVSPLSSLEYLEKLEQFLTKINDNNFDCKVASGGGRTFVTMDRYESDWSIVERGYNTHVLGEARAFSSAKEAIETYRNEGNYYDQDLPPFILTENNTPNNTPIGKIEDGDSFILFNYRGDRAIQITRALTEDSFSNFPRKRFPKIHFAGIMQYDGDLKIPENFLVSPPTINNTMTELLSNQNIKQFACSETQKFGHVTYFWNGNRSEKYNDFLENYIEIPSDNFSFSERPWMKSAEIADETIKQMENDSFQIGRINFANGDMVGHTGNFAASIVALGAVDLALGRLMQAAKKTNTVLLVTADHGNADEMFEIDKKTKTINLDTYGLPKPKTSHTLAPVPFSIYNQECLGYEIELRKDLPEAGLANIASTVLELAGFKAPPFYEQSLIQFTNLPLTRENTSHTLNNKNGKMFSKQRLDYYPNNIDKRYALANISIELADIIAHLRAPDGCPWDKEQTFSSLKNYMIEEAYEAVNAVENIEEKKFDKDSVQNFCEELGDVLLQVFLNAQIASEKGLFNIENVFESIRHKMVSRHPHVFSSEEMLSSSAEVITQWETLKQAEGKQDEKLSILLAKAINKASLPTLSYAAGVSKAASKIGFSWPTLKQVFNDVELEMQELHKEIQTNQIDYEKVADEIGDVVFALANFVNFIKMDAPSNLATNLDFDLIARSAVRKFVNRFCEMEKIILEKGIKLTPEVAQKFSLDEWNDLWKQAKTRRYR